MEKEKGRVYSLNIGERKGEPKKPVSEATFLENFGIVGDVHAGLDEKRQVSILSWERIKEKNFCLKRTGENLKPGDFAENITIAGLDLTHLEIGTRILTVFAFSTDNFKRSKEEVKHLMKLFEEDLKKLGDDSRIHEKKVRIKIIGSVDLLPKEVREAAIDIMKKTEKYDEYYLNIAIGYGGREEIVEAIKRIAKDIENGKIEPDKIDKETVYSYLYTSHLPFPDPDLVMRTSGEERISNFLLWQLAYSELYFTDVYWPALKKTDFLKAIQSYQRRQRRYGK